MNILGTITTTVKAIACMAFAASVISCSQEELSLPETPKGSTDGEISILFEVEGDMPLSRGIAATAHERLLRDVYILFFEHLESESDLEVTADSYIGYVQAGASEGKSTISFDPPEYLRTDKKYRLLVVGNSNQYTLGTTTSYANYLASFKAGSGYNEVRSKLLAERDEAITSSSPGVLPLSGRFVKQTTDQELYFSFSRTADGVVIPDDCIFRFQRAVCRVDLHNLVGNVLDIRYMRIVNTRTMGSYFFDGLNQGDQPATTFSGNAQSPGFVEMPEEFQEQNLQRLEATLYCFPNTVNTCLPDDKCTTAVMIAGYYIDPETNEKDENLTYYRFNIMNAGDSQALQRNYCYRASIKSVTRRGEDTEEKAYNATSPVFNYDISEEWDTDDDNAVSDSDGNFLVVSKSMLTFTGDQCGADVIKLTVNTNPEVTWDIEMDEESAGWFQYKKISEGQGEKIKAFTCGPTQTNFTDYYRTGTLTIVAKNNKTGKELRKLIRLVQLTTQGDVKCLVVNDYTTDFTQEVSQYGQTISYKIITGNPTNKWTATDVKNTLNGWTDKVSFTESGTNGNYFTITFPANIGEPRSLDIKFVFDCDDKEANKQVKPITVTFTQDICMQPLTIEGWPSDGELTLNCFNTQPGYKYANCVAQAREYRVHLQKPDDHYFTVTSTFDKYRDLTLSEYNGLIDFGHEIRSIHNGLKYLSYNGSDILTDDAKESDYSDDLGKRTADNNTFFINAFRMGPGDVTIEGTITVQVKDKKTDENIPNGRMDLTVQLVVPSDEYMLNDVMIKNDLKWLDAPIDNGWIYIMDRNIGCKPRMYKDDSGKIYPNKAQWCYLKESGYSDAWKITNMTNDENWLGRLPLEFPINGNNFERYNSDRAHILNSWKNELKNTHGHLGKMYENADKYPWNVPSASCIASLRDNMYISKSRFFLISEDELCPVVKDKKVKVCCWLPSGVHVVYGYSDAATDFGSNQLILNSHSKIEDYQFWQYSYGYASSYNLKDQAFLIRLMYLIGAGKFGSTPYIPNEDVPDETVESQLKYYKEHILKCYDAK